MRTFIALELPGEIKQEIAQIQQELKKAGIEAKWVRSEITHLTLAFLGSITPNKVDTINNSLEAATSGVSPIRLQFHQVGCFPSPAKARVVFVDLQGELGKLHALALKIRKVLEKEKIWFDKKPFVSHATLGRIRKKQNLTKLIKEIKIRKIKFMARKIVFYQSSLTESGPVYQPIKTFVLD